MILKFIGAFSEIETYLKEEDNQRENRVKEARKISSTKAQIIEDSQIQYFTSLTYFLSLALIDQTPAFEQCSIPSDYSRSNLLL